MKFDIEEKDGKIVVFVEIPHEKRTGKQIPRQRIETEDVLKILEENGYKGPWHPIQKAVVKNWRENTRKGTWIFEKKIKKSLDKPVEKVILTKEEKPSLKKPKTKRKTKSRTRKPATKKAVKKEV